MAYTSKDPERFLCGAPILDLETCYPIGVHTYHRANIGLGVYFNSLDGLKLYFDYKMFCNFESLLTIKQHSWIEKRNFLAIELFYL